MSGGNPQIRDTKDVCIGGNEGLLREGTTFNLDFD